MYQPINQSVRQRGHSKSVRTVINRTSEARNKKILDHPKCHNLRDYVPGKLWAVCSNQDQYIYHGHKKSNQSVTEMTTTTPTCR